MIPCPTHGSAKLKQGKNGGWFCAGKLPDGSWCQHKPGNGAAPVAAPSAAPAWGPTGQPTTDADRRLIAAMDFASRLYHGQGQEGEARALICVRTALSLFA